MLGAFHNGILHWSSPVVAGTWKVASGVYLGTGAALPITGLGFRPQFLIIKASGSTANDDPVIAWSGMTQFGGGTPAAGVISPSTAPVTGILTSYDSDGFTLANNTLVNTSGMQYYWTAIAGSGTELAVGNYLGNGIDNSTPISGLSFQPSCVFIRRRNLTTAFVTMKHSGMSGDSAYFLGNAASTTSNVIQAFNPTSVELGTNGGVNGAGASYDWVAFAPPSGYGVFGYYNGTGSDNFDAVTGLAFQPQMVLVKGQTNQEAVFRTNSFTGDNSAALQNSVVNAANRIQGFNSDGFQVGTNAAVNSAGTPYHYMALRTT
jgi:hypothetical protein